MYRPEASRNSSHHTTTPQRPVLSSHSRPHAQPQARSTTPTDPVPSGATPQSILRSGSHGKTSVGSIDDRQSQGDLERSQRREHERRRLHEEEGYRQQRHQLAQYRNDRPDGSPYDYARQQSEIAALLSPSQQRPARGPGAPRGVQGPRETPQRSKRDRPDGPSSGDGAKNEREGRGSGRGGSSTSRSPVTNAIPVERDDLSPYDRRSHRGSFNSAKEEKHNLPLPYPLSHEDGAYKRQRTDQDPRPSVLSSNGFYADSDPRYAPGPAPGPGRPMPAGPSTVEPRYYGVQPPPRRDSGHERALMTTIVGQHVNGMAASRAQGYPPPPPPIAVPPPPPPHLYTSAHPHAHSIIPPAEGSRDRDRRRERDSGRDKDRDRDRDRERHRPAIPVERDEMVREADLGMQAYASKGSLRHTGRGSISGRPAGASTIGRSSGAVAGAPVDGAIDGEVRDDVVQEPAATAVGVSASGKSVKMSTGLGEKVYSAPKGKGGKGKKQEDIVSRLCRLLRVVAISL